jgi:hypothetical protein
LSGRIYNSADWTGKSPPSQLPKPSADMPRLLDDQPIDHRDGARFLFGQDGLYRSLWDYVVEAIHQQPSDRLRAERRQQTIALFGRYGQGKSSLLETLKKDLDGLYVGTKPVSVREFDVALHPPDSVQYNFHSLISVWFWRERLGLAAIVMVTALLVAASMSGAVLWLFGTRVGDLMRVSLVSGLGRHGSADGPASLCLACADTPEYLGRKIARRPPGLASRSYYNPHEAYPRTWPTITRCDPDRQS